MLHSTQLCAGGCGVRFVKLLLGPGTDFVQFRVESSDLGIQFNESQTRIADQLFSFHSSIIMAAPCSQTYAGGWLLGSRIVLQVQEIET